MLYPPTLDPCGLLFVAHVSGQGVTRHSLPSLAQTANFLLRRMETAQQQREGRGTLTALPPQHRWSRLIVLNGRRNAAANES